MRVILSAHHDPCSEPALGWRKQEKALQASFLQLEFEEELEMLETDKKDISKFLDMIFGMLLKW